MEIKIDVTGNAAEKMNIASVRMAQEVDKALLTAAIWIDGLIKKKVNRGGRGGSVHRVGRGLSQRSKAGEPPKSDSGNLVKLTHWEHSFLEAFVGTEAFYAVFLEKGTSRGLEPRPLWQVTKDETQPKVIEMVEAAMKRAME